jgi:hypothetical protein
MNTKIKREGNMEPLKNHPLYVYEEMISEFELEEESPDRDRCLSLLYRVRDFIIEHRQLFFGAFVFTASSLFFGWTCHRSLTQNMRGLMPPKEIMGASIIFGLVMGYFPTMAVAVACTLYPNGVPNQPEEEPKNVWDAFCELHDVCARNIPDYVSKNRARWEANNQAHQRWYRAWQNNDAEGMRFNVTGSYFNPLI